MALVCSEVIRESGHGRYMQELARHLAAGGHEVHVYADQYQPVPGVTWHRVSAPVGLNLLRVFVFWWRASRALARAPFDVVHTIGGCCTRRDVVTAQFCQRAWGAQLASGAAPKVGSPLRRLYHAIYWRACDWLEAPAFRDRPGKRVIAVSRGVRAELETFYGTPAERISVIYNGVEPADFAPEALAPRRAATRAQLGLDAATPVLLFVGDFYRKGLAVVISALAQLATPNVRLLVVGRGEIAAFRERARELGVADRLDFVGFQPDVVPYFAAADLFVFPTRYEPFGMVITEAMAAGLPTITTAMAGAAEVIAPGVSGEILDDPTDAPGLARRLDALLADPARRRAMGEAAREAARAVDWAYVARETLGVYRAMLAERDGLAG